MFNIVINVLIVFIILAILGLLAMVAYNDFTWFRNLVNKVYGFVIGEDVGEDEGDK